MSASGDSLPDVYKNAEAKMHKALEATRNDFSSVRTGRASPSLLDRLHVEAYGASVSLKSAATVSAPDSRTLQIQAFDRATIPAIRRAIETSDLGLTPNVDGQTIRLTIPALNEERRKELAKIVRKKAEDGRVAIRNIRHHVVDELKALHKNSKITDDEHKRAVDHVQKLTDKYAHDVDGLLASKEKEIMEV